VKYVHRNPGKFLNAAAEQSSLENEQTSVGLEGRWAAHSRASDRGADRATQSHTYSREGERVEQGERMGIIRFGSRVDVFVPPGSTVHVKAGETTVAGTTVIAEFSSK
jgi:phosphatidylserine decarboxylase